MRYMACRKSQSPQIGSMFLTGASNKLRDSYAGSQSPQIGSRFLTLVHIGAGLNSHRALSQSPQIGSRFLTYTTGPKKVKFLETVVAIPSNRVKVSYKEPNKFNPLCLRRNPLKSGQGFLRLQNLFKK